MYLICFMLFFSHLYSQESSYSNVLNEESSYSESAEESSFLGDFDFNAAIEESTEEVQYHPHQDFVYLKHRTKDKEILTFRTTNVLFNNELGNYCVRFVLRNENRKSKSGPIEQSGELLLDVDMKTPIAPYYMNLQKAKLSILGVETKQLWSKNLSFNAREIEHTVKRCSRFEVRKDLMHKDIEALNRIFSLNTKIFFSLEGSEGVFEFVLDEDESFFYKEFFKYAKMINFF